MADFKETPSSSWIKGTSVAGSGATLTLFVHLRSGHRWGFNIGDMPWVRGLIHAGICGKCEETGKPLGNSVGRAVHWLKAKKTGVNQAGEAIGVASRQAREMARARRQLRTGPAAWGWSSSEYAPIARSRYAILNDKSSDDPFAGL